PLMSRADQDAYFADVAPIARLLGADPVPMSRAEADALIEQCRTQLAPSPRSREVARIITRYQPPRLRDLAPQAIATQAAVDLL
ncbi:oxygenase MpaB family protein, partial [Acinetobacter baumannii]